MAIPKPSAFQRFAQGRQQEPADVVYVSADRSGDMTTLGVTHYRDGVLHGHDDVQMANQDLQSSEETLNNWQDQATKCGMVLAVTYLDTKCPSVDSVLIVVDNDAHVAYATFRVMKDAAASFSNMPESDREIWNTVALYMNTRQVRFRVFSHEGNDRDIDANIHFRSRLKARQRPTPVDELKLTVVPSQAPVMPVATADVIVTPVPVSPIVAAALAATELAKQPEPPRPDPDFRIADAHPQPEPAYRPADAHPRPEPAPGKDEPLPEPDDLPEDEEIAAAAQDDGVAHGAPGAYVPDYGVETDDEDEDEDNDAPLPDPLMRAVMGVMNRTPTPAREPAMSAATPAPAAPKDPRDKVLLALLGVVLKTAKDIRADAGSADLTKTLQWDMTLRGAENLLQEFQTQG